MNLVQYNPIDPEPFYNAGPVISEKKNNIGMIILGVSMILAVGALIYIAHEKQTLTKKMKKEED